MTQEEKQLLLKDLCARLPYHPILHFDDKVQQDDEYLYGFRENGGKFLINDAYYIEEVKPYLRSMSSMTEEEFKEYHSMLIDVDNSGLMNQSLITKIVDWLNEKMFDHRNLLPKGLAIEALENMYKTE